MKVLVTGGAGFVGSQLARHLANQGDEVTVVDSLARRGSERNARWLQETAPKSLRLVQLDVRDGQQLKELAHSVQPRAIYHLAAQVAVTTSVVDPETDFDVNA